MSAKPSGRQVRDCSRCVSSWRASCSGWRLISVNLPSCIFFACRAPYFSSPDSNGWGGFSSAKKAGKKKRKRLDYVDVYGEQVC